MDSNQVDKYAEGMPNGSAGQEHLETQVVVVMITMQVVVVWW
jgi:hypothetical protein